MSQARTFITLWAGLAIGGNLIAAPAKFQVETLTLSELLQVGRVQFAWIGMAEMVCLAAIIILSVFRRSWPAWSLWAAMGVFAAQQLILQPMLQSRSDHIIAGGVSAPSHLHLVFIAAECLKVGLLLWTGGRALKD